MSVPVAVGAQPADAFRVHLPSFEGPLQVLLHLVESRELDLLTIPLAEVADAYVAHLASHPVEPRSLAEFLAIAAQLILLKSRRLLPEEPEAAVGHDEGPDEEELRSRVVEYRAVRDAALRLAVLDGTRPIFRREPRDADLPIPVAVEPMPADALSMTLAGLLATPEPEPEPDPPEIVAREITIADQIQALRSAMGPRGRTVLQAVLAGCRSRTEAAVTVLAMLELVRRRQVRIEQRSLFGPITISALDGGGT